MQGWDKKCLDRLKALMTLELSGSTRSLVEDLHNRYEDANPHFFTSKQRKLIDKLYDKYFDRNGNPKECRWSAQDKRLMADLIGYLDTGEVPRIKQEIAESLVDWCRENQKEDGITQGRRVLISEIIEMARNHGKQQSLYDDLKEKFNAGGITNGSPAFAESVLKQFEEKGLWTETQQEHIEKMLADNEDPED